MPRKRVASPPWTAVLGLLHLRLKDAAAALGITTCHLKFLCHGNGLTRWPGKTVRSLNSRLDRLIREAAVRRAGAILPWWAAPRRPRRLRTIAHEARIVIRDLDILYDQVMNPPPEELPDPEHGGDGTMNLIDYVGVSRETGANI